VDLLGALVERVFSGKLKHVIETPAHLSLCDGSGRFSASWSGSTARSCIRDTNEVDFSLTNRLYRKRGDSVDEILTGGSATTVSSIRPSAGLSCRGSATWC